MLAGQTLSVVMPTWNCAPMMRRHMEAMNQWVDLADEVICVDSKSGDGTVEIIKAGLGTDKLRVMIRGRGLYESWNEGIAATTGDFVYISTAGDTIEREHLVHLGETMVRSRADVVISPPRFVGVHGEYHEDLRWPPGIVVASVPHKAPFVLSTDEAVQLAMHHSPNSLLGSSASNLYKGAYLRANPFPTGIKGAGDTVWALRNAEKAKMCLTPSVGSTFCVHPKENEGGYREFQKLLRMLEEERSRCIRHLDDERLRRQLERFSLLSGEVATLRKEAEAICQSRRWPLNLIPWLLARSRLARARSELRDHKRRRAPVIQGSRI